MIVSHEYRYVFVELPHTGTTAISKELRESYGGCSVLNKHAHYAQFLAVATEEERSYKVFSGIRNPMDEAVSMFFKFKSDHKGKYSNTGEKRRSSVTRRDMAKYEFIAARDPSFAEYFLEFYRWPYDNWSAVSHHRFDLVLRFESLQDDFSRMLAMVGAEQVRPLPVVNKTSGKKHYLDYYTPETWDRARRVFGPFMRKWGYEFPKEWGGGDVPASGRCLFGLLAGGRRLFWRHWRWSPHLHGRLLRWYLSPRGARSGGSEATEAADAASAATEPDGGAATEKKSLVSQE